jgi:hypothetical protein
MGRWPAGRFAAIPQHRQRLLHCLSSLCDRVSNLGSDRCGGAIFFCFYKCLMSDFATADLNHMPEYSSNDYSHTNSRNMQIPHSFSTVPQAHNGTFNNDASALDKVTPLASRTPTKLDVSSTGASPAEAPTPSQMAGTKRKQSHDTKSPDSSARVAAEEDKRRRNTAASARFRVKKKQREQALEHTVKEASDKNAVLEARVSQLELENKWLKNLITEKNNGETSEGQKSDVDIAQMFKKFLANQKTDNGNPTGSKIGVGTSS